MEKFWDSDEGSDNEEVLRLNVTTEEMELEAVKTESVRRKEDWSLAERLERKEKKRAEKRLRMKKKKDAEEEEALGTDEAEGSNIVEEVICKKKKRKVKGKKLTWGLPEIKLMRVDEVEETAEDEKDNKDEMEEVEEKIDDMEDVKEEEQIVTEMAEEGEEIKEEVKKEVYEDEEKAGETKVDEDEDDDEMKEITTRKEAKKEARKWQKVLDGIRDRLDVFEDGGMEKAEVRKCRRDLEGVKGGLAKLSDWPENSGKAGEETGMVVEDEGKMKMKIKKEKGEEMAVAGGRRVRKDMIPMVVDLWVARWSSVGKEDVKVQVFDCEERWTDREVKDGLWETVFKKERYDKEDMKKLRVGWKRRERGQQLVTFIYELPFKMLATMMEKSDKSHN